MHYSFMDIELSDLFTVLSLHNGLRGLGNKGHIVGVVVLKKNSLSGALTWHTVASQQIRRNCGTYEEKCRNKIYV